MRNHPLRSDKVLDTTTWTNLYDASSFRSRVSDEFLWERLGDDEDDTEVGVSREKAIGALCERETLSLGTLLDEHGQCADEGYICASNVCSL